MCANMVNIIFYMKIKKSSSTSTDPIDKLLSMSEVLFTVTNKHTINANIENQIEINFDDKISL